jgi:hypothetical protein
LAWTFQLGLSPPPTEKHVEEQINSLRKTTMDEQMEDKRMGSLSPQARFAIFAGWDMARQKKAHFKRGQAACCFAQGALQGKCPTALGHLCEGLTLQGHAPTEDSDRLRAAHAECALQSNNFSPCWLEPVLQTDHLRRQSASPVPSIPDLFAQQVAIHASRLWF